MVQTLTAKGEKPVLRCTIFIHGTLLPFPSLQAFKASWQHYFSSENSKSFLALYLESLRTRSIYRFQPIGPLGLHRIDNTTTNDHYPSTVSLAKGYEFTYHQVAKTESEHLLFYTFGWPGLLSQSCRTKAAETLWSALSLETTILAHEYPDHHIVFDIVAHSHGANVALSLALLPEKKTHDFTLDNLILFGAPVQQETADAIHSSLFTTIYHIYSGKDFIQTLDFVSTRGRSHRKFTGPIPDRLQQVSISVNHFKPGHASLWMVGTKENRLYDHCLPFKPWPLMVFTPLILEATQTIEPHQGHHLNISWHANQLLCDTSDKIIDLIALNKSI